MGSSPGIHSGQRELVLGAAWATLAAHAVTYTASPMAWRPGTFCASIVFDESLTGRQIIQSEYGRITRASSWSVTGELPIAFQISAVTLPPVKSA